MRRIVVLAVAAAMAVAACGTNAATGTPAGVGTPPGTAAPAASAPGGSGAPAPTLEASPVDTSSPEGRAAAVGHAFISAIAAGDTAGAQAMEDATMSSAAPAAALGQLWSQLVGKYGAFTSLGDVTTTSRPPYLVAIVPAYFADATLTLTVTVDDAGRVAGLHVEGVGPAASAAPGSPAASTSPAASPAAYVDPGAFTESDVTVGTPPWALPGTLSMPKGSGPFPGVVLVAGSGPNDRDETIGPNKPLRDIAWGLASRGIAVLRYDKRTAVHGAAMDPETVTVREEVTDDAAAAIDLLRATPGVDPSRVFLAGHSLGGYLAPRIAAENAGKLRGIALLEAPHTSLPDLILAQSEYLARLAGSPTPSVEAQLAALRKQVALADSSELSADTPRSDLPLGLPASYLLDLRSYDPLATAAGLRIPILLVQGGRDYQVTPAELDGWRTALAGRGDVTIREYPALDHLMLAGSGPSTPSEYDVPGHVDGAVVADLAAWVAGR